MPLTRGSLWRVTYVEGAYTRHPQFVSLKGRLDESAARNVQLETRVSELTTAVSVNR